MNICATTEGFSESSVFAEFGHDPKFNLGIIAGEKFVVLFGVKAQRIESFIGSDGYILNIRFCEETTCGATA